MNTSAFPNVVIRASAGSGKTYQLSNRYLGLLLAGAEPDAILAGTFTRKAAGEIFDRILLRLAEAATSDKKLKELAQAIGQPKLKRADLAQLLGRTLRNLHRLRIGTLDSFFAKVAGALAWELGLPSGWSIASTIDNEILREEAVEEVIGGEDVASLLALLHLLTKGAAHRSVSELISSTVSDLHGLFCETNEAAWNKLAPPPNLSDAALREALAELRDCEQPKHKSIIKGLEEDFARAEAGDWKSFVKKGLAQKVLQGETSYYKWTIPEPLQAVYQRLLDQARAVLVGWVAKQTSGTWSLLSKFDQTYRRVQHRERLLQFGDITRAVARAAGAALHSTATHRLDGGVQHLLLDEFQDTSLDQWRALRPMVQGVVEHPQGSFFCVGDPKQAIYGWRGGLPEIFSAIDAEVPSLTTLPLDRSFRSAPPVIDAVNQIFSKIDSHPNLGDYAGPIRAWREQFPQHETQRTELPGYVRLETTAAPDDSSESNEDLEGSDLEEGEELTKNQAHYRYVAERVRDLAAAAPGMSIGVLTRSNKSIGWLITLLRQLGVSASEEGGNPLVDASAVQVVLSLLKLADHPGDTTARFHIASSPIARALESPEFRNDFAAERFAARIRRELQDDGYGPAVYRWAGLLAPHCDRRELSRLQQLVEQAYAWPASEPLRTQMFLAHLEKEKVGDPSAANIRVMTVHQSKGLQFGVVVLPELHSRLAGLPDSFVVGRPNPTAAVDTVCRYADSSTQALMPPQFQRIFRDHKAQKLGELLCVLYVALTRAEHALHMLIPPSTKSEKRLPLQVDGLLRAALVGAAPTQPQSLLWETGDPNWFDRLPAAPAASPLPEPKPLTPIRFAASGSEPLRQRERRSPSSLEGGERVELASLFRAPPRASFDRGTLLHHWLEGIIWLDSGPPSVAELVARAERLRTKFDLSAFNLLEEAQRLLKELEAPAVRELLLRNQYLPACRKTADARPLLVGGCEIRVQNERSFAVPLEGQLLSGAIDRLCLVESGGKVVAAEVLDFKTDELASQEASRERADFYRPQITAYKQAVAKMHQLTTDCVSARLVFLRTGVVVPV